MVTINLNLRFRFSVFINGNMCNVTPIPTVSLDPRRKQQQYSENGDKLENLIYVYSETAFILFSIFLTYLTFYSYLYLTFHSTGHTGVDPLGLSTSLLFPKLLSSDL